MSITDAAEQELAEAGRDELLAFGWTAEPAGPALARGGLVAAPDGEGWIVSDRATGAGLAVLPTASAVRRFAQRAARVADPAAEAPRLAAQVLDEELKLSREAVVALERAVADLEEQISDLQAKDLLSRDS